MLMRLVVGVCCFDLSRQQHLWDYSDRFRLPFVYSGSWVCEISILSLFFFFSLLMVFNLGAGGGRSLGGFRNGERRRGTLRVSLDKFANWVFFSI